VRIVYGIQSTGKGHLSRFLGLKPFFDEDGHELMVIASGYEDPPEYFLEEANDCRYERFLGISYVGDGEGGISKRGSIVAFARHLPALLAAYRRAQALITEFAPHVIVSDFDPITGSIFIAPGIPKVGLSHQSALLSPGMYHPPRMHIEKFFTWATVRMFTDGLDHKLGCHFYPANRWCMPPIIRPAVRDAATENRGHIVVYHTLPGMLSEVLGYAERHPERRLIVYGNEPQDAPENVRFELDRGRFAPDLAAADAYVGTAGFQSISEAFYLGKKIAVKPLTGQYEQIWNAAQLEHHGMGRWHRDSLEDALDQEVNRELHERLLPWFRDGARTCYERILSLARRGA